MLAEVVSFCISGKNSLGLTLSTRAMRMSVIAEGSFFPVSMLAIKLWDILAEVDNSS